MERRFVTIILAGFLMLLGCSLNAQGGAHLSHKDQSTIQPRTPPSVIWVADFDIDTADVKEQKGILSGGGPLRRERRVGAGILNRQQSPEHTARQVVDLLSVTLIQELQKNSLPARRLSPGDSLPDKGWLIRGQFMEVDEGNRLRRAVIGFGAGATNMQIEVAVVNRETHPEQTFLLMGTDGGSGKMPGAVVTMNPYVAAAKFVMAKNAPEKDVKAAAKKIASELIAYMNAHGLRSK
jgi:hypothetical protein